MTTRQIISALMAVGAASLGAEGQLCNPPAPTGVSATDGTVCGSIRITWNPVSNALSYRIYRGTTPSTGSMTYIGSSVDPVHTDIPPSLFIEPFYYRVRTVRACGTSGYSGADSGWVGDIAHLVENVAASDNRCDGVRITWDWTPAALEYKVLRHQFNTPALASEIATVSGLTYLDLSASSGQEYHYWVRGVGACGPGPLSAPDTGLRPAGTAPTIVSEPSAVTVHEGMRATLSVTAHGSALQYAWERLNGNLSNGGGVSGVGSAQLIFDPVSPSHDDHYRVVVSNVCGSDTSNWARIRVLCYADCNGDGQSNLADFGCFQTKFALNDPYADCNRDGQANLADFGCFQTKFALGCP